MSKTIPLEEAHRALISAKQNHDARKAEAESAALAATNALNHLNNAQKVFDASCEAARRELSPRGSDWARRVQGEEGGVPR